MAACATGPYALVLVPALMYASYKASDYVEEKQNQLESWINSFCDTDGAINTGSENVKLTESQLPVRRHPSPPPHGAIPEVPQGNPHGVILPLTCLNRQRKKQYHWRRHGERCYHPDGQQCRFYGSRQCRRIASVSRRSGINGVCHHGGRAWRNQKDVDFPEAGEDTALCDKENKPPRIAGAAATSLSTISLPRVRATNWSAVRRSWKVRRTSLLGVSRSPIWISSRSSRHGRE